MKVTLINYTQEARELLLFTKQTRLSMDSGLLEEIRQWPEEKKQVELDYMLKTIKSSWEFCNYVFSIEGVSRAFTHQLVRTRSGHYAQQSQRTVNMEGFEYIVPDALTLGFAPLQGLEYRATMNSIRDGYEQLIKLGVNPQDARGVLPTNVSTNIIVGANLRTLSEMAEKRLCYRTQGEYQQVFRLMVDAICKVHLWAEPFLRVYCVATGVCQFPNFTECPIKPGIFNPETGYRWDGNTTLRPDTKQEILIKWQGTRFEAVPKEMRRG
jgi:flavin-dependent thymidylate synthase